MELSLSQIYNEFAVISLAVAAAYLGAIWLIMLSGRLIVRFRPSPPASCRPGEMVHQALKVSGRLWDHYRTAALLFGVSFLLLVNFGRDGLVGPQPTWLNAVVLAGVLAALGFGALKTIQLSRYRSRLNGLLDMHMQMAQRMVEAQLRGNRVFPSVRINDEVIDNVVVGENGVYLVQLIPAPAGVETARFERGSIIFDPCGTRVSLQQFNNTMLRLGKILGEQIGSEVKVMPVAVVPECRIVTGAEDGPMLVSLQACAAFVGWRQEAYFLHEDDIIKLSGWLGKQALEDPPRTLSEVRTSLQRQIGWPALV